MGLQNYLDSIAGIDIREFTTDTDFSILIGLLDKIKKPDMKAIEIGCWKGSTTGLICQAIKPMNGTLYCIDPWDSTGTSQIFETFEANMAKLGNTDIIKVYKESSLTAHEHFENDSVDIIFIDGLHTYNYIYNDANNYYPKLKKGGIICGHDCNVRYETLTTEAKKEIDSHIYVDCSAIESLGKRVHCGITKALYDIWGSAFETAKSKEANSIWWKIKE